MKYLIVLLLLVGAATWYEGWEISSIAYGVLGVLALLTVAVLGYLIVARVRRSPKKERDSEISEEKTPPKKQDDHGESHGSSGGHGGGHHGPSLLDRILSWGFVALMAFVAYWLYQHLHSLEGTPLVKHPVHMMSDGPHGVDLGTIRTRKLSDSEILARCNDTVASATTYPASPTSYTEIKAPRSGLRICVDSRDAKDFKPLLCKPLGGEPAPCTPASEPERYLYQSDCEIGVWFVSAYE